MLYGLFVTLYVILALVLALIVLVQRGKGSSGFDAFSGGTQVLFGGSGGQDFLQKTTWFLGALFLAASLYLTLYTSKQAKTFRYLKDSSAQQVVQQQSAESTDAADTSTDL